MNELLAIKEDIHILNEHLLKMSFKEFIQIMESNESHLFSGSQTSINFIRLIFNGLLYNKESVFDEPKFLSCYKKCVNYLLDPRFEKSKVKEEICNILMTRVKYLESTFLLSLINHLINKFSEGDANDCVVELLARFIESLEKINEVEFRFQLMTGLDCKKLIVKDLLFEIVWNRENVLLILSLLTELTSLTNNDLTEAINKTLSLFPTNDLTVIIDPVLVHQMIKLVKSVDLKNQVISRVIKHFGLIHDNLSSQESDSDENRAQLEAFEHAEAVMIQYITLEANSNVHIVKEVAKTLKAYSHFPHLIFTPFNFALALSLSNLSNCEDLISPLLKSIIKRYFQYQKMKREGTLWFKNEEECPKFDICVNALKVIPISIKGQFLHLEIMQFAFQLVDMIPMFSKQMNILNKELAHLSPLESTCFLGAQLIIQIFEVNMSVRETIIVELFGRVSERTGGSIFTYISIFSKLLIKCPQLFIKYKEKMKEIIEWIPCCSFQASIALLKALIPLLKISLPLKNVLVTSFRKCLFHRNIETRKVALCGFLIAIKYFKVSGSMPWSQSQTLSSLSILNASQLNLSQRFDPNAYEALCIELFRILQKCLLQPQMQIRQLFYEGICSIVRNNSQLIGIVSELLLNQFKKHYITSQVENTEGFPFNTTEVFTDTTTDEPKCVDPVIHLFKAMEICVQQDYEMQENLSHSDEESLHFSDSIDKLKETMTSFIEMLKSLKLKDLGFDHSVSLKDETCLKTKQAIHLLGVFEICMEHCYLIERRKPEKERDFQEVIGFYDKCVGLAELIRDVSKSSGNAQVRKGSKKNNAKRKLDEEPENENENENLVTESILNSTLMKPVNKKAQKMFKEGKSFITLNCLSLMFQDIFQEKGESFYIFSKNHGFITLLVSTFNSRLMDYISTNRFDEFTSDKIEKLFPTFGLLCKSMLRKSVDEFNKMENTSQRSQKASHNSTILISLCAEAMHNIFLAVWQKNPPLVIKLAQFICDEAETLTIESMTEEVKESSAKICFQYLEDLIYKALRTPNIECVSQYLSILDILISGNFVQDEYIIQDMYRWCYELARSTPSENPVLVKNLLQLLLKLGMRQNKIYLPLLKTFALDLHKCLGDIDESFTVAHEKAFQSINSKTILIVCNQIIRGTEFIFSETEWIFDNLKNKANLMTNGYDFANNQRTMLECKLCKRLNHTLDILLELSQSNLPLDQLIKDTFNLLKKFYEILTNVTRYFISLYNSKTTDKESLELPSMFVEIVKRCGTLISRALPKFFEYNDASPARVAKKNKAAGEKDKLLKKSKNISSLIFAAESYERFLLDLQKKSQVNLIKFYKISQGRDFKLKERVIQAKFNNIIDDQDDD